MAQPSVLGTEKIYSVMATNKFKDQEKQRLTVETLTQKEQAEQKGMNDRKAVAADPKVQNPLKINTGLDDQQEVNNPNSYAQKIIAMKSLEEFVKKYEERLAQEALAYHAFLQELYKIIEAYKHSRDGSNEHIITPQLEKEAQKILDEIGRLEKRVRDLDEQIKALSKQYSDLKGELNTLLDQGCQSLMNHANYVRENLPEHVQANLRAMDPGIQEILNSTDDQGNTVLEGICNDLHIAQSEQIELLNSIKGDDLPTQVSKLEKAAGFKSVDDIIAESVQRRLEGKATPAEQKIILEQGFMPAIQNLNKTFTSTSAKEILAVAEKFQTRLEELDKQGVSLQSQRTLLMGDMKKLIGQVTDLKMMADKNSFQQVLNQSTSASKSAAFTP